MNLTDNARRLIGTSNYTSDGDASLRCRRAAELIFNGRYEEARESLGALWPGVGRRPPQEGFADAVRGEVLLQCGALSGRLGSVKTAADAQEAAKDLISESVRIFESLGLATKVAEAQYELSACYWRLGALDEARVVLADALGRLTRTETELRAKILIMRSLVEVSARRYDDALEVLEEAAPVFESAGEALKGKWHGQRALVLLQLSDGGARGDAADRAIIEFTAAAYHLERAGHDRFCGNTLNNLAFLLNKLGRHGEAHEQLERARRIFTTLRDAGNVAQVDETRARVLSAEGRYAEAKGVIAGAVRALKEGGGQALLADALVVEGVVLARLGEHEASVAVLREAMLTAEAAGAPESAGHAALTLIEEHARARLSQDEACEAYGRADDLLARTQDAEDLARLRACARAVMEKFVVVELPEGFSLPRAVREYEARFIGRVLAEEDGSVSRAARRLGVTHQSLAHTLRTRHRQLLTARTPAVPRRRSIIRIKRGA